ncbi:unnamed protein product [Plutella xylostella]|uniref:(diamondback moth) hypothetical protein n=1 Tax=Plutella xylostella TaxID=51655 RepID=A0A8S4G2Z1_PLUXY|nr:unnamed protein product [Plutella xylostella]
MWSTYGFMLYILLCIFSKYGQGYRRPDGREFYDPRKPSNWNPKRMRPRGQSRAKPSNLYSLVPAGDGQYFKLAPISAPDDDFSSRDIIPTQQTNDIIKGATHTKLAQLPGRILPPLAQLPGIIFPPLELLKPLLPWDSVMPLKGKETNDKMKYSIELSGYNVKRVCKAKSQTRGAAAPVQHRLARCAQSVHVCGPGVYNALPTEIKDAPSLPAFKQCLKRWLAQNAFYTMGELISRKI